MTGTVVLIIYFYKNLDLLGYMWDYIKMWTAGILL